jgi:hypothetical protein
VINDACEFKFLDIFLSSYFFKFLKRFMKD